MMDALITLMYFVAGVLLMAAEPKNKD